MPGRLTVAEREAYRLGRLGFERGDTDLALAQLSTLLQTRPRFADVHYMVGVLLEAKGDVAGAEASLRQALRINPSYCEATLALASVYERRGDYAGGRSIAQRLRSPRRSGHRSVRTITSWRPTARPRVACSA